jgi:hypothetical protein
MAIHRGGRERENMRYFIQWSSKQVRPDLRGGANQLGIKRIKLQKSNNIMSTLSQLSGISTHKLCES